MRRARPTPCARFDNALTLDLLVEASREGSQALDAIETILKGPDIALPDGMSFLDAYGINRTLARQRWWDPTATMRAAAIIPDSARMPDGSPFAPLPETPLPPDAHRPYGGDVRSSSAGAAHNYG